MLIYLDMCCLKRPFDDQSQTRIRLETEAVLTLLSLESDSLQFVRSSPLLLENAANPHPERAARVNQWLSAGFRWRITESQAFEIRVASLVNQGLKTFDALHVASAEQSGAAYFVTTDDRLLGTLLRLQGDIKTRACSPLECVQEVSK